MGRLTDIDWNLVQFKYEVLGYSIEEIQDEYQLSDAHINYISKGWKRVPAAERKHLTFTKLESLEEVTEEVKAQIAEESETLTTLKQKYLLPKFLELENAILTKAISLAQKLDADKSNVNSLQTLTSILNNLLPNNPLINKRAEVVEPGTPHSPQEWKLTIVDPTKSQGTEEAVPTDNQAKEV